MKKRLFFDMDNVLVDLFKQKVILTHRKDFVQGDILIDNSYNNGACNFHGEWIRFGKGKFKDWNAILDYLLN